MYVMEMKNTSDFYEPDKTKVFGILQLRIDKIQTYVAFFIRSECHPARGTTSFLFSLTLQTNHTY